MTLSAYSRFAARHVALGFFASLACLFDLRVDFRLLDLGELLAFAHQLAFDAARCLITRRP
jgi:hypothetical protein